MSTRRIIPVMKKITHFDRSSYQITRREYTDEGFLRVPGRVARTGIQEYLASEFDLPGDPNRIVRVMRPEDEVFDAESLASYAAADVTVEHPAGLVDAETYSQVSVGTVIGPGTRDGDFVTVDHIIKDKRGIAAVESGKVQLSAGYTAIYDDNVPDGADYEYIQREIRINHVALVDRARAGHQARLFDNQPGAKTMPKVVLDSKSGQSVEVDDANVATLINNTINGLTQAVSDAAKDIQTSNDALATAQKELEKAKQASSDSAIAERVTAVTSAMASAKIVAGDEFTCDSMSVVDIQRAALAKCRPSTNWADKDDLYVGAYFDAAEEAMKEKKEADDEEEDKEKDDKKKASDSFKQLSSDAAVVMTKQREESDKSRQASVDSMTNAWQNNGGDK